MEESFFTAPAPPPDGGRHSAVRASRPDPSAWPSLLFVVVIAELHFLVGIVVRSVHGRFPQRVRRQIPQCPDYQIAYGGRLGIRRRVGTRFHGSAAAKRHIFHRRTRQVKEHQTLAAQANLIEERAEERRTAPAPLAAFEMVAVIVLTGDHAD